MYIVIAGCGRVGAELAHRLFRRWHEVAVVDEALASFRNLPDEYRGRSVEGSVLSEEVLRRAEIQRADGLAAVTSSDTVNAVVAHAAREIYRVRHVVVRNYDPRLLPLHLAFHHRVVSSTVWGAERIEELLHHPGGENVLNIPSGGYGAGGLAVCELHITESWAGRRLGELLAGVASAPMALTRDGAARIADLETRLEAEDDVHVTAPLDVVDTLLKRLAGKSGKSGKAES